MQSITHRRVAASGALAVAALAAALTGGCTRALGARVPPPPSIPLVVENGGFHDVAVYVLRGSQGPGERVGTVTGLSTAKLAVRQSELQTGGAIVLRLHAIGTQYSWVSPALAVGDGLVPRLSVHMNADGDMERSILYSQIAR